MSETAPRWVPRFSHGLYGSRPAASQSFRKYFELAESLQTAKRGLAVDTGKSSDIYFAITGLPGRLSKFSHDDNGFGTSKRVAGDLLVAINEWTDKHAFPNGQFNADLFSSELHSWEWSAVSRKIDSFRSVFEAECHDVDVYSVGQISIYKTAALVSEGSNIIPKEYHQDVSAEVLAEFDNAGKCLAFDLPTHLVPSLSALPHVARIPPSSRSPWRRCPRRSGLSSAGLPASPRARQPGLSR